MTTARPGRGLGRGLASLIRDAAVDSHPEGGPALADGRADAPLMVRVEEISPNPEQPRQVFDQGGLDELAASLRNHGVLSPLVVRRAERGYILIAGERRWRAAALAGLQEVPVVVRDADQPSQQLELALVENLQRADLDPIESARGFQRLIDEYGYTQDQVASAVNKDRSTVANLVRLLKLPEFVLDAIRDGRISAGHARALLAVADVAELPALLERIVDEHLNVRQTEKLITERTRPPTTSGPGTYGPIDGGEPMVDFERMLEDALSTTVSIKPGPHGGGRIIVEYADREDLDRLIGRLGRELAARASQ